MMVSVSAVLAVALPTAFAFSPTVSRPAGWAAAELYWPAVACIILSCVGSTLLLLAAVRNSPMLLMTAGSTAAVLLTTGLAALFPTLPGAVASGLVAACETAVKLLVQLSCGVPLLYAALVGVSAATNAVGARQFDGDAKRPRSSTAAGRRRQTQISTSR